MGNDKQRPVFPQILDLPTSMTPEQFQSMVKDRIHDLNLLLRMVGFNPALASLSMGNFRITALANPTDDLDAVNLRTLRGMLLASESKSAAPSRAATAPTTNGAGPGGGVPLPPGGIPSGAPPPPGTPNVPSLPDPATSTIDQRVILNGIPFIFRVDPLGGPVGFWAQEVAVGIDIRDTHANRALYAASSYPVGTTYLETDRNVIYMVQNPAGGPQWMFHNGVLIDLLANIPTDLGPYDVYFTFQSTDFLQSWVWNGTQLHFVGLGSGYTIFVSSSSVLPYGVWGLCDGSTYTITQDDASLLSVTPAIYANQYIRR